MKSISSSICNQDLHSNSSQIFLSSIIHELKNPLNIIMGISHVLQKEIANPDSLNNCIECAKDLREVTQDLNELIHDILEVNYCNDGFNVCLNWEIDIKEIIRKMIKVNKDYAIYKRIIINSYVDENLPLVFLDQKRMKQIIANLISNAIKYSPKNSEIDVLANIVNNHLVIKIKDQGFGMNKEDIKNAFERFKTINNPNSGKVDSFGLGLPIVKELVEKQNGSIYVNSEVGKGTEFILSFNLNNASYNEENSQLHSQ